MKCPNCGCPNLRAIDTLDTEYDSGSYYDVVEGTCPDCGKSWRWVEVFTFDHYEDIEGIEINDHL